MASPQVLPNTGTSSRRGKERHLEAGRRRLEEFRRKKAEAEARRPPLTSQPHVTDVDQHENQPLETERVRLTSSDGVGTSEGAVGATSEPSGYINNNEAIDIVQNIEQSSSVDTHASPPVPRNEYNSFSADAVHKLAMDQDIKRNDALGFSGGVNVNSSQQAKERSNEYGIYTGAHAARYIDRTSSQSTYSGIEDTQSYLQNSSLKDFAIINPGTSHVPLTNVSLENSDGNPFQNKYGYASMLSSGHSSSLYEDRVDPTTSATESALESRHHGSLEFKDSIISGTGERKLSGSVDHLSSAQSAPWLTSDSISTSFNLDVGSFSNHEPLYPARAETNIRRSRPSFLDSLNMPRVPSTSLSPLTEEEKAGSFTSNSSKTYSTDVLGSSASQKPFAGTETAETFSAMRNPNMHSMNSSVSSSNGGDSLKEIVNGYMGKKYESHSVKQDEDFAALEQHIEDLTQEKFSLQRALEASRALAESLAAENSSLTESYNQQGSVVNQLKSDMDTLQEEIKAQLVELESVKLEYGNVLLECNAADERAKLLASEVIGLEEKALRLRSNELKLERQLENSHAEISSCRKKMSSLEKERQDLQSTIDALQEEKKLLQSKIRKASASGKSIDVSKSPTSKKEASTCTDDLVNGDKEDTTPDNMHDTNDASVSTSLPETGQMNLEVSSTNIPLDQMRMIQNINALISELALEKEELVQALAAESSQSSKLKDLNKELSRKLESQTQRLELLIAQSMANENSPAKQPDSQTMQDNPAYADEGDEVVERVLGWIMKLFPGGPSKRRTSKLL